MLTYKLYTYDTWGNVEDGYQVNGVHGGYVITTRDKPLEHDDDVLAAIQLYTGSLTRNVAIDHSADFGEHRFELVDTRDGKPLGYVEAVKS